MSDSIFKKSCIKTDIFVLKTKKIAQVPFDRPLISYNIFNKLFNNFIEHYWCKWKRFFSGYHFIYLFFFYQSLKWKNDYILFLIKKRSQKNKNLDVVLDHIFEDLEMSLLREL